MSGRGAIEALGSALLGRPLLSLGSGTWALALLLRALRPGGGRLAMPAFLCHNPLAATLHAGWTPWFCDVDPATGVPDQAEWSRALDAGVDALLLVHLFGNPVDPLPLQALCRARGAALIEDACQALGASIDGRPCGSYGDAALLSFGHSKQVDAGGGALLAADDPGLLERVRKLDHDWGHLAADRRQDGERAFAQDFYRRKARLPAEGPGAFAGLIADYLPLVPRAWQADEGAILAGLQSLPQRTAGRRRKAGLYRDALRGLDLQEIGMAGSGAPWRYCLRWPGRRREQRERVAAAVRARGVDISSWYLPTPWLMPADAQAPTLSGTEALSAEVFQLWLDERTDDARIAAAAAALRTSLG